MGLSISGEDLIGCWSLTFADIDFVNSKPVLTRLGLAVQLKFFASHGFFATDLGSISVDGISYVAEQLGAEANEITGYDFSSRTARRHCAEILQHLGFGRMKRADRQQLELKSVREGEGAGELSWQVIIHHQHESIGRNRFMEVVGRINLNTRNSAHVHRASSSRSAAPRRPHPQHGAVLRPLSATDAVRRHVAGPRLGSHRHFRPGQDRNLRSAIRRPECIRPT